MLTTFFISYNILIKSYYLILKGVVPLIKILFIVALTIIFYGSSMSYQIAGNAYFKNPNAVMFQKFDEKTTKLVLTNENQLVLKEIKDELSKQPKTSEKNS